MSRPLSLCLAAALAASSMAMSAAPASAFEFTTRSGEWHNDNRPEQIRGWRHNRHNRHFTPGFSFSIGVPFPPVYSSYRQPRDCYRTWDGELYCRAY